MEEEDNKNENSDDSPDDVAQPADIAGKTSHDTQNVQQVDDAQDAAGDCENEQPEVNVHTILCSKSVFLNQLCKYDQ